MVNPEFWKGKKVLLTGHTGFKGTWLKCWLEYMGAIVCGFSLPPEENSLYTLMYPKEDNEFYDIRDAMAIHNVVSAFQPEIVFHLAAQPIVSTGYEEPAYTFTTNFNGTLNLYEALRTCKSVKSIITITTDKVYEDNWNEGDAYREHDPLGGYDPYSASKACVELLSNAYRSSYFDKMHVALSTARAGNVYGFGDYAHNRLIPDFVKAFKQGKDAVVRNITYTRPFQHVLDVLQGYLLLAQEDCGPSYNFAPKASTSVEKIANLVTTAWGGNAAYRIDTSSIKMHETNYLNLDSTMAREIVEWKPILDIETELPRTINNYKHGDSKTVLARIIDYMERMSNA
jgi:CDP-glucose 4,6-dehydratase